MAIVNGIEQLFSRDGSCVKVELVGCSLDDIERLWSIRELREPVTISLARELETATLPGQVEIDVTVRRYGTRGVRRVRVVELAGVNAVTLADAVMAALPFDELAGDEAAPFEWPADGTPEARRLVEQAIRHINEFTAAASRLAVENGGGAEYAVLAVEKTARRVPSARRVMARYSRTTERLAAEESARALATAEAFRL